MRIDVMFPIVLVALSGCASTCLVDSQPQGALVSIDDKPCGKTPVMVDLEEKWFGSAHQLRVAKDGFYADVREVSKSTTSIWEKEHYPSALFIRLAPIEKEDAREDKRP